LTGGSSASELAGTDGGVSYNKDLTPSLNLDTGLVQRDADVNNDGFVDQDDATQIGLNYNSRAGVGVGLVSLDYDIAPDNNNIINVRELSRIGFEFGRGT
jgi:hypothetical protein